MILLKRLSRNLESTAEDGLLREDDGENPREEANMQAT